MSFEEGVLPGKRGKEERRESAGTLRELATRRFRVAAWLTGAMLVVYFAFILLIAFDKELMARKLTDGLSVGILLGVIVVLVTWILTWVYVGWVNRRYEPGIRRLRR